MPRIRGNGVNGSFATTCPSNMLLRKAKTESNVKATKNMDLNFTIAISLFFARSRSSSCATFLSLTFCLLITMIDPFIIIFISLSSAIVGEAISWFLIYRTEDYKSLKSSIEKLSKQLDKKKDTITNISKQKVKDKKVAQLDERLRSKNKDMAMVKFKSMFFVALTLLSVFAFLNNMFDGQVVAKLPFTPFPLIRGMTHRNLPGSDFTDCSMVFVYVLCSLSIRSNVQRFFGFTPPKGSGSFMPAPPQ